MKDKWKNIFEFRGHKGHQRGLRCELEAIRTVASLRTGLAPGVGAM